MKIINLFGGPGIGKSTTRAIVFGLLKLKKINIEETTEYAKDLVWEEHNSLLTDQLMILANQNRKLERLKEKLDFVINDSPLLLSLHYKPLNYLPKYFQKLVFELWNSYDNENFLLKRVKEYSPIGRNQSKEEAMEIDNNLKIFLQENNIPFSEILGDENAPINIINFINEKYNLRIC